MKCYTTAATRILYAGSSVNMLLLQLTTVIVKQS